MKMAEQKSDDVVMSKAKYDALCAVFKTADKLDREAFAKGVANVDVGSFRSVRYALDYYKGFEASPSIQDTVPKHKFDTLVEHCKRLDTEIAQARAHVNEVTLYQQNAVWFWQHDGQDYLHSLSCPIIIQPHQLIQLLKGVVLDRTQLRDAIAAAIGGDTYDCTRVWSAWGVGTMDQDDFVPLVDQEDRLDEIVDSVLSVVRGGV